MFVSDFSSRVLHGFWPFPARVDLGHKGAFFEVLINLLLLFLYHLLDLVLLPDVDAFKEGGMAVGEVAFAVPNDGLEGALDVDLILAALVLLQ